MMMMIPLDHRSADASSSAADENGEDDHFDHFDEEDDNMLYRAECEILSTQRGRRLRRAASIAALAIVSIIVLAVVVVVSHSNGGETSMTVKGNVNFNGNNKNDEGIPMLTPAPSTAAVSSPDIDTAPSPATSSAPTTSSTPHKPKKGCLTDRFDNENMNDNNRLYPGQFICSKDDSLRYRFGVTNLGDVVWNDTQAGQHLTVYRNPYRGGSQHNTTDTTNDDFYLTLQTNGTMVLHRTELVGTSSQTQNVVHQQWTAPPDRDIVPTTQCLQDHDCPYWHLHSDGVMVVNWINDAGWQAHNFLKVYSF